MAVSRIDEAGLNVNQYGNRNLIINGAMNVSQRATSATAAVAGGSYITLDRYKIYEDTDGAYTSEQSTTAPDGFPNSMKLQVTTADTSLSSAQYAAFGQFIEAQNLQQLAYGTNAAKDVTVSFYVRSNKTGTYCFTLDKNDSTQYLFIKEFTIDVADTWERKIITVSPDSQIKASGGAIANDNGAGLRAFIFLAAGSDYHGTNNAWNTNTNYYATSNQVNWMDSTSNDFYITGLQIEVGDTATDFEHRTFDDELRRCKRYFESKSFTTFVEIGYSNGTTSAHCILPYLEKRAAPTVTLPTAGQSTNQLTFRTPTGSNPSTTGSNTAYDLTTTQGRIQGASYAGLTAGGVSSLYLNGTASITFDAEL